MKWLKKIIICCLLFGVAPINAYAKSISFNSPIHVIDNKYVVTVTINNMNINYLQGYLNVTNGTITNVTMASGWINKTGNNNNFYFYHSGNDNGSSLVATIEITITGNSEYSASNLNYGSYSCQKDNYNNYFGPSGELISSSDYINICENGDATLKSLKPSVGTLSPSFSANNYSYNLYVEDNITNVTFEAIPSDNGAKVLSGVNCTISSSVTKCPITVLSATGKEITYNVCVHRAFSSDFSLSDFKVANGHLDKSFSVNETTYNLTPNDNANYVYFTFKLNGITHTSEKCSSESTTCSLTVSSNGVKKNYIFYLTNQNEANNTMSSSNFNTTVSDNVTQSKSLTSSKTNETIIDNSNDIVEIQDDTNDSIDTTDLEEINDGNEIENVIDNKKDESKNVYLVIICFVNLMLGLCLGLFIKRKSAKK